MFNSVGESPDNERCPLTEGQVAVSRCFNCCVSRTCGTYHSSGHHDLLIAFVVPSTAILSPPDGRGVDSSQPYWLLPRR